MSTPSIAAKYDSNRATTGQFTKGNRATIAWSGETALKFRNAQAAWLDAVSPEDMRSVADELKWLCMQRDDLQTKQRAIVYFLDRQLGKPVERLDVSTSDNQPAPVRDDLTPKHFELLEAIVSGNALPPIT